MSSNLDNMKQAVFELFGVGSNTEMEIIPAQVAVAVTEEVAAPAPQAPVAEAVPAAPMDAPAPSIPVRQVAMSYIAAGTIFEGTMHCEGDVDIAGTFKGDLESKGNVSLYASMEGNITAASLTLTDCTLTGNATLRETLTIHENAGVCGNITAIWISPVTLHWSAPPRCRATFPPVASPWKRAHCSAVAWRLNRQSNPSADYPAKRVRSSPSPHPLFCILFSLCRR